MSVNTNNDNLRMHQIIYNEAARNGIQHVDEYIAGYELGYQIGQSSKFSIRSCNKAAISNFLDLITDLYKYYEFDSKSNYDSIGNVVGYMDAVFNRGNPAAVGSVGAIQFAYNFHHTTKNGLLHEMFKTLKAAETKPQEITHLKNTIGKTIATSDRDGLTIKEEFVNDDKFTNYRVLMAYCNDFLNHDVSFVKGQLLMLLFCMYMTIVYQNNDTFQDENGSNYVMDRGIIRIVIDQIVKAWIKVGGIRIVANTHFTEIGGGANKANASEFDRFAQFYSVDPDMKAQSAFLTDFDNIMRAVSNSDQKKSVTVVPHNYQQNRDGSTLYAVISPSIVLTSAFHSDEQLNLTQTPFNIPPKDVVIVPDPKTNLILHSCFSRFVVIAFKSMEYLNDLYVD